MASYSNGYIPQDLLVKFETGWNDTDGNWHHSLSPTTYAKHLALRKRAFARTGKWLEITNGWSAYRPYDAQVLARRIWGNGAAAPGTSSHGGFWEGRQTLAMDYGNWITVYDGGDRDAFYADCRAVGLTPGMISPARGYPDEPWHVIDLDPWGPIPADVDSEPFPTPKPIKEDDMAYPILLDGLHRFLLSPGQIKHFLDQDASDLTRNIVSADDKWIGLSTEQFLNQLDSFGIPRDKVNTATGAVFDVSQNKMLGGGMWSWARAAYQESLKPGAVNLTPEQENNIAAKVAAKVSAATTPNYPSAGEIVTTFANRLKD